MTDKEYHVGGERISEDSDTRTSRSGGLEKTTNILTATRAPEPPQYNEPQTEKIGCVYLATYGLLAAGIVYTAYQFFGK